MVEKSPSDSVTLVSDLPAVPENRFRRFAHVDALRAFAITLVALFHVGVSKAPGDSGVTVFFTISGFIITSLLLSERSRTGTFRIPRFYVRRFLKLAPPFAIAILVPSLIAAALSSSSNLLLIVSQALFSFNWALVVDPGASSSVLPGSAVTWSLGVEEQFYIAFSLLWILVVRLLRPERVIVVLAAGAVVTSTIFRAVYLVANFPHSYTQFSTFARMDAIAIGVLIAIGVRSREFVVKSLYQGIARDRWLVLVIVAYPLVGVPQWNWWESLVRPLAYPVITGVVIIYGIAARSSPIRTAFNRVCGGRLVTAVGVASYSIYLVHAVFFGLVEAALPQMTTMNLAVRVIILIPLSFALGWLLYRVVEVPVLRWRVRRGL